MQHHFNHVSQISILLLSLLTLPAPAYELYCDNTSYDVTIHGILLSFPVASSSEISIIATVWVSKSIANVWFFFSGGKMG